MKSAIVAGAIAGVVGGIVAIISTYMTLPATVQATVGLNEGTMKWFVSQGGLNIVWGGYGLRYVGIVLLWPSSDMELVSGIEGASAPPGWNPTLVDPTTIPPGSEGKYFQMSINTGEHVTVDREWLTVTFHCLGPGPSTISIDGSLELRELPAGSTFDGPVDPIEVTINQIAPVGGVTTPVNKTEILTPYLALAGLIAVASTVYVIKKRKTKQNFSYFAFSYFIFCKLSEPFILLYDHQLWHTHKIKQSRVRLYR
jgi:hypothetical protein